MTEDHINVSKKGAFFFIIAALYGASGVIMAATGRHWLSLESNSAESFLFNNAVFFQIMHAMLLMWLSTQLHKGFWLFSAAVGFTLGVLMFCGGLYLLILQGKTFISWVTPIGGSFLILGWINLVIFGFLSLRK